jgi:hypothetical protein
MAVLALSTLDGEPISVLAVVVVALGLLGLVVGTALRVRRRV